MSYDPTAYALTVTALEQRRRDRENEYAARKARLCRDLPGLAAIYDGLVSCAGRIAKAVIDGNDAEIERARTEAHALNRRKIALLQDAGHTREVLSNAPICEKCNDSGFIGVMPCVCFDEEYRRQQARELTAMMKGGLHDFDDFELNFYSDEENEAFGISPRENMRNNLYILKEYAAVFAPGQRSLVLIGDTGLGKTFLSGCMAKEVSARGYSVAYESAYVIFSLLEDQKFGRGGDEDRTKRYFECDLLILDDLGCELAGAFSTAALYNLVNSRLLNRRSTIINTNLTLAELKTRYSAQIYSRIAGDYDLIFLFGQDIRPMLK